MRRFACGANNVDVLLRGKLTSPRENDRVGAGHPLPIFGNSDDAKISSIRFLPFQMHDLDFWPYPMWSFGRIHLKRPLDPSRLLRQQNAESGTATMQTSTTGVLAALRQPSQGRWCGLAGSRLTDETSRKTASVRMYAGCAWVAAGFSPTGLRPAGAKACRPVVAARSSG